MNNSILSKLQKIQSEMKAPKNLYNSFGKYKYRNAEGILEAFKPFGDKYKLSLIVSDDIVAVSERVYVKAICTLYDNETGESVSNTAYARESLEKKGMDESQITGTASSYARKYALNGLFLLDDTKDADSDEYKVSSDNKALQEIVGKIRLEQKKKNISDEQIEGRYGKFETMTLEIAQRCLSALSKS